MSWPKKILVPFDGSAASQEAFKTALAMARGGGNLRGLFVMDRKLIRAHRLEELATLSGVVANPNPDLERRTRAALRELGKDLLGYFERACRKAKVPCEIVLSEDAVADGILAAAVGTDAVVMGRHGERSASGRLGSNADRVARNAAVPLVIVPGKARGLRRIAVAYDGSGHGDETLALAGRAAESWGASLSVVYAGSERREADRALARAKELLRRKAAAVFLRGRPEEVLPRLARSSRFDMLAMGAYGHGSLREFLLGSLTDLILRQTRTPLLIRR